MNKSQAKPKTCQTKHVRIRIRVHAKPVAAMPDKGKRVEEVTFELQSVERTGVRLASLSNSGVSMIV